MRVTAQYQPLLRLQDCARRDRTFTVAAADALEARLPAQRVHQPRLAGAAHRDQTQRLRRERLPGLFGVLRGQRANLLFGEIAEPKGLGLDVECAAAEHHSVLGAGVDAVVSHVAHPAQHDAVRESVRTLVVAGAKLAQHRQQRVADQRVDLVDQQHQRERVGHAPARQRLAQRMPRPDALQQGGPQVVQRLVAQRHAGPKRKFGEDGADSLADVLPHRLRSLDVGVHAANLSRLPGVEQVAQGEQRRGLAGLPWRVQHEVLLVAYEAEHVVEVEPRQRRNVIVPVRADWAFSVELALARHWQPSLSTVIVGIVAGQRAAVIRTLKSATARRQARQFGNGAPAAAHRRRCCTCATLWCRKPDGS